jgi:hypothetical protein
MNADSSDLWARALQARQTATLLLSIDPDAASRAYYVAFYKAVQDTNPEISLL